MFHSVVTEDRPAVVARREAARKHCCFEEHVVLRASGLALQLIGEMLTVAEMAVLRSVNPLLMAKGVWHVLVNATLIVCVAAATYPLRCMLESWILPKSLPYNIRDLATRLNKCREEKVARSIKSAGLQPLLWTSPPHIVELKDNRSAVENHDQLSRWNKRKTFFDAEGKVVHTCEGYHHPERFGALLKAFMATRCFFCTTLIKEDQSNSFATAWATPSRIGHSHICDECAEAHLTPVADLQGDHVPRDLLNSYQFFYHPATEDFVDGSCQIVPYMYDADAKHLRKRFLDEQFPIEQASMAHVASREKLFGKLLHAERLHVQNMARKRAQDEAKQRAQDEAKQRKRDEDNRKRKERRQRELEKKRAELEKKRAELAALSPEQKEAAKEQKKKEVNAKRRQNRAAKKAREAELAAKEAEVVRLRDELDKARKLLLASNVAVAMEVDV